ncbi:FadR/GntR family transcriptional regulator [Brevibacillus sp. B_LB10_24]|uniref:FadR/GntR family transcriptional regulator n=1 Tax=Brevibacillus sp. B_LB10_24 TaxID=3380645 RepID=UPI0038B9691B
MNIEKIPNRKISDIVSEKIEQWIVSGKVQPGDKLPSVRELCEAFDVGRSAIRDAITTLKGKGLVDVKRGEGTYVCHYNYSQLFYESILLNRNDVIKIYNVRKILEAGIAESAAVDRQPEHLAKMKHAIESMKSANSIEGWEADYEFHLSIAEATQNEILVQLMEIISSTTKKAIMDCHRIIFSDSRLSQNILTQHENIYKAIEEGDSTAARQRMLEHLTYVESLLNQVQDNQ